MTAARLTARILLGLLRFAVPVVIILLALAGGRVLMSQRPEVARAERVPQPVAVETVVVERGTRRAVTTAFGTVQPRRSLTVRPQVAGRIIELHPDLIAGGAIERGAVLLRIEATEYEAAAIEAESAVARAAFELAVEEGRAGVARREWELLDDTMRTTTDGGRLARREPHLAEKRSALAAAEARLDRARLDVARTTIRAPFNCTVLEESIETGQIVSVQTSIATLIGTDAFHVRVSVPVNDLALVQLPGADGTGGSSVRVMHETGAATASVIEGRIVRLLGDVDPAGRMARLLVEVADPLGRSETAPPSRGDIPLLVGEFVRVEIEGRERADVVAVPRRAMREGDRVWVVGPDGRLEIRPVTVAWGSAAEVVVSEGLEGGERLVLTPLAAPVPGMPLVDVAAGEGA